MRGLLTAAGLAVAASGAMAQPADCPSLPSQGPSVSVTVGLAGRWGMPRSVNGEAGIDVPMQAPRTDCGEPSAPTDVLRGEPGDLLRGTPAPAGER